MHGDLSALIITGAPSLGDLAEAWSNIYAEYLDLNEENEALYILLLQRDISLEATTINEVSVALNFLAAALHPRMSHYFHPGLVDILTRNEIDYPFDLSNPGEYRNSLEISSNRLASMRFQLEVKTKELSDYMASRSNDTVDDLYFDRTLTRLARFRRCAVIRDTDITVKEFVLMLKDYLDYMKARTKKPMLDGEEG